MSNIARAFMSVVTVKPCTVPAVVFSRWLLLLLFRVVHKAWRHALFPLFRLDETQDAYRAAVAAELSQPSCGKAFVSFEYEADASKCLALLGRGWWMDLYLRLRCRQTRKPRFRTRFTPKAQVPPEPTNIIWQHLEFGWLYVRSVVGSARAPPVVWCLP